MFSGSIPALVPDSFTPSYSSILLEYWYETQEPVSLHDEGQYLRTCLTLYVKIDESKLNYEVYILLLCMQCTCTY